ncbi:anti-sigma factor family protein [Streptomyces sp. NPDC057307]|uniref:anti-sigma factor family protein n=1 Tax=Streptomyces sp. NPDC057307 TaxID=3346096 RepID=UPI00363A6CBF
MTTTTGTTEHPDVSEISDLTEGLLSPARSAELREHLDSCSLCADVHESLEEIRGLLGSLPGPPRMPADVAARVDAALAAEALLSATAPDPLVVESIADVSRETSRPTEATDKAITEATDETTTETTAASADGAPDSREPASEPVPAADAPRTDRADRPAGRPRAATGPGRARQQRRRRGAILGAVFGTAAIGVSVLLFQTSSLSGGDGASSYKSDAGASQADGGGAFSGTGMREKVHTLLKPAPATGEPRVAEGQESTKEAPSTSASPKLMQQVPPCIQQGTGRPDTPLAAERGTYEGTDAYLLVLSDPTDGSLVQAYVIDAACVDNVPPVKGELLLTQTYPRR